MQYLWQGRIERTIGVFLMSNDTTRMLIETRKKYHASVAFMRQEMGTAGAYLAFEELLKAAEAYRIASMKDEAEYAKVPF